MDPACLGPGRHTVSLSGSSQPGQAMVLQKVTPAPFRAWDGLSQPAPPPQVFLYLPSSCLCACRGARSSGRHFSLQDKNSPAEASVQDGMSQVAHVQGLCLNTCSPQGLAGDHGQRCQHFYRGKKCVPATCHLGHTRDQPQLCCPSAAGCLSRV